MLKYGEEPEVNDEELFGTEEERADIVEDIKKWAKEHPNPDRPLLAIVLGENAYTFSPESLAEDAEQETALGVQMIDMIIYESRRAGISPLDYLTRITKVFRNISGSEVKRPTFENEVN